MLELTIKISNRIEKIENLEKTYDHSFLGSMFKGWQKRKVNKVDKNKTDFVIITNKNSKNS